MITIYQCQSLFLDDTPVVFVIANSAVISQSLLHARYRCESPLHRWMCVGVFQRMHMCGCVCVVVRCNAMCRVCQHDSVHCDTESQSYRASTFCSDMQCALILPWWTKLTLHFLTNIIIRTFIAANKESLYALNSRWSSSFPIRNQWICFPTLW